MLNHYPPSSRFVSQKQSLIRRLLQKEPFHTGEWQSMDTSAYPTHATHELMDVSVEYETPLSLIQLREELQPDLPWADDHFEERVSGKPLNPPPSHVDWPFAVGGNGRHLNGEEPKFDHTYPERFWPKYAGHPPKIHGTDIQLQASGIRFVYGDLNDVISLLHKNPHTRQAYLPIWFPEDTGATVGQRVPCTLGYHFMIRRNVLSMRYYMRSCDILRHYTNDVYFATRLIQFVAEELNRTGGVDGGEIYPGNLTMHIASLHAFVGDRSKLEKILEL